jgi:hypothetical protein
MYIAYKALVQTEPEESCNCTEAHPLTFKATADPDTMYLHEALKQPDQEQFLKAMDEEIEAHHQGKHWKLVSRSEIPKGKPILPAVWAMKCKRHIDMREIYKWKA